MSGRLYFLHIPKTGGTSLFSWLQSRFDPHEVCPAEEPERLLRRPKGSLDQYRLIGWHYGLHVLRLFDERPRIVTLLRDPLSRSISHYRDIQSRPGHPLYPAVRGWSFERFVMSDEGESELLNLQCRFLALDDYEEDFLGHARLTAENMDALREKYSDGMLLDQARRTLESLDGYGLCERLDEAAARIAAVMGWPRPGPLPRLNAERWPFPPEALTAASVARVLELTGLDRALYHEVAGSVAPAVKCPPYDEAETIARFVSEASETKRAGFAVTQNDKAASRRILMTERTGSHELLGDNRTGFELPELGSVCKRSVDTFADLAKIEQPCQAEFEAEIEFVREFYSTPRKGMFGGVISPGDAVVINEFIRTQRPDTVYEIGVASGFSSLFILSCMQRHGLFHDDASQLLSFDLLERHQDNPDMRVGRVMEEFGGELNAHWRLQTRKTTIDLHQLQLPDGPPGGRSLAFVDGGHCHPWPLIDVFVLLGRMPAGSWILLQDIALSERLFEDVVRFGRKAGYGFRGAGFVFEHYSGRKARGIEGCFNMAAIEVPADPSSVLHSLKETLLYPFEHSVSGDEARFVEKIREAGEIVGQLASPAAQ